MINIIDNRHENMIEFSKIEPGSIFEVPGTKGMFVKSFMLSSRGYPIGKAFDKHGEPIYFLDCEPWARVAALNVNIIITNGVEK